MTSGWRKETTEGHRLSVGENALSVDELPNLPVSFSEGPPKCCLPGFFSLDAPTRHHHLPHSYGAGKTSILVIGWISQAVARQLLGLPEAVFSE